MDFETSCWATGPLTNGGQSCYNYDNPVQRRPKIDYFDSAAIPPIVSHISSNGYYGYCPTPNVSAYTDIQCNDSTPNNAADIDYDVTDAAMEAANSEQSMQQQQQQQLQQQHQGRTHFENRKRSVQFVADEFTAERDAKRRRSHVSVIDYVEDMQMGYDDDKDIMATATIDPSNIASEKLSLEPYFVCIDTGSIEQFPRGQPHTAHQIDYIESKSEPIRDSDSTYATKKTDTDNSTKECVTNDMENLYWHTHGSMLWQR